MPTFRVRTTISLGTLDAQGRLVSKDYLPGETIELSKEEAEKIRHALINPPLPAHVRAMDKEERRAYDSDVASPFHPESGVVLPWKVDGTVLSAGTALEIQEVTAPPESPVVPKEQEGSKGPVPEHATTPKEVKTPSRGK